MLGSGIDVGSRTIKIVIYDSKKKNIIAKAIDNSGVNQESIVGNLFEKTLKKAHCTKKDIKRTVATGYGRELIGFADRIVTEIICHAKGVYYLLPETKSIIEIGGQDSKIIKLSDNGNVIDFAMNDRCAAGTGRFLENVAKLIEIDINEMKNIVEKSKSPAHISSMCVVFAESEIIGLLSKNVPKSEIVAGVQNSIASRIMGLASRMLENPVVFTGGVALNSAMAEALQKETGKKIIIPEFPQFTGALGAAIIATE